MFTCQGPGLTSGVFFSPKLISMNPLEEYITLIHYWQQNPCKVKGEIHHIIPQSLGGPNRKWNKVKLPTLDHIEAHRLLKELYPTGKEHLAMSAAYDFILTTRDGVKLSPEEAAKARDDARRASSELQRGRTPWNKGKTGIYSEETLAAIRAARARQGCSDETRRRMRKSHLGHSVTEDTRRKCSQANLGIPKSPEHRQKLRESALKRWAKLRSKDN